MSKALGGAITRNPVKEIGWGQAGAEPLPLIETLLAQRHREVACEFDGVTALALHERFEKVRQSPSLLGGAGRCHHDPVQCNAPFQLSINGDAQRFGSRECARLGLDQTRNRRRELFQRRSLEEQRRT